jgi:hypothetical protein
MVAQLVAISLLPLYGILSFTAPPTGQCSEPAESDDNDTYSFEIHLSVAIQFTPISLKWPPFFTS